MKKRLIGISAVVLVLVLLLTLAPCCGKEEGEVKTIKFGILQPLSGPAAPWGVNFEKGTKWAVDKVNAAGGIKVGKDRYMIETVSCDTKYIGSEAATCATRFVYEEGIHYVIGPISTFQAVDPIFAAGKCFYATQATAPGGPDTPYRITATAYQGYPGGWSDTFLTMATKARPELKTICSLSPLLPETTEELIRAWRESAEGHGMTVLDQVYYPMGTTDWYPYLTKILALNPDVIYMSGSGGDVSLQTKQARELGFEGWLWQPAMVAASILRAVAGPENMWKIASNEPDWSSDVYPERAHELNREWQEMIAPGEHMDRTPPMAYSAVMMYVKAIEQAGSIDPNEGLRRSRLHV